MATILFSFAGSCIKKLQEIITDEAIQILHVKQELSDLQQTMMQVQCFLIDADRRRIEDFAVSNWLGELKDAMYDADNCWKNRQLSDHKIRTVREPPGRRKAQTRLRRSFERSAATGVADDGSQEREVPETCSPVRRCTPALGMEKTTVAA